MRAGSAARAPDHARRLVAAVVTLAVMGAENAMRTTETMEGMVVTVTGPVTTASLGSVLPHEHLMVDFVGADRVSPDRYDADMVFRTVLPQVERARAAGLGTLVECTPAFLGRDAALMRRLAQASGVNIVTNTGYYGAAGGKFLPAQARSDTPDQLAARWTAEWRDGIEGTGIRPGFVKIGTDAGTLPEANRKLARAAALTHLATGLTVACHCGDGDAALDVLGEMEAAGCGGGALVWVHAQNEKDPSRRAEAAHRGVWVEFDAISTQTIGAHVGLLKHMRGEGLLGRVLVSHDAGWYAVGEPDGGVFRAFDTLFTEFIPALRAAGFTDAEIRRVTVENPAEAFAVRVRRR
jgi:predicted metal-dependent phosphotriesterase family hydrolase